MVAVFVSHSSLDRDLVKSQVVDVLQQHGLQVWFSSESIHAADEWESQIRLGLEKTEWFLVALTVNSTSSEWVRAEVDWALENRRGKLVPVLLDDCNPQDCNLRLRQIQHVDLRAGNAAGKNALLKIWELQSSSAGQPINRSKSKASDIFRRLQNACGRRPVLALAAFAALLLAASPVAWRFLAGTVVPVHEGKEVSPAAEVAVLPPKVAALPPSAVQADGAPKPAAESVVVQLGLDVPVPGGTKRNEASRDVCLSYEYQRKNGALHIGYRLPYLELQREGKQIRGLRLDQPPFAWDVPVLSFKVLNRSAQSVLLTECLVEVTASQVDTQPVLVVGARCVNGLLLINEGWGDVVDPLLTFRIEPLKGGKKLSAPAEKRKLSLKTFTKDSLVPLLKFVPKALEDEEALAVLGDVELGPAGQRRTVPFATTMIFDVTHGTPLPPSYTYDLALTAGKTPDTVRVPISHTLKPGEADQFLLRVASDRSAHYEFNIAVLLVDGKRLPDQQVVLDVFVPRTGAGKGEKSSTPGAVLPIAQPKTIGEVKP